MKDHNIQFAGLTAFVVLAISTALFHGAENAGLETPIEPVKVLPQKKMTIGPCSHLKYVPGSAYSNSINTLDEFIACQMNRKDI